MFRGFNTIAIDAKGRAAVPARYREQLVLVGSTDLVITLNPWDRCLWLYPLNEWELIEAKLNALSDFDRQSRRTKQIVRGHATDCSLDAQGRVLIPNDLRQLVELDKRAVFLGQGNKFEIWNEGQWNGIRDDWLSSVDDGDKGASSLLTTLSL